MGATEEIHEREKRLALELFKRLITHLREHESAAAVVEHQWDQGFSRGIDFKVGSAPLRLVIHVVP